LTALVFVQQGNGVDWSPWGPYLPVGGTGACSECCFDDVIASNAAWFVDGTYEYTGLVANNRPTFSYSKWTTGQGPNMEDWLYREGEVYYDSTGNEWILFATYSWWYFQGDAVPGSPPGLVTYANASDALTPPATGWQCVTSTSGTGDWIRVVTCGDPSLSGGESCVEPVPEIRGITIVPTGEAGEDRFLDRGLDLPEGQEPPLAGLLPVTASYFIGETITGSCQAVDEDTRRPVLSFVHVYAYAVEPTSRSEELVLLDHWLASYDRRTWKYRIEWDTSNLEPGYYELYLAFEDQTSEALRIELTPPVE